MVLRAWVLTATVGRELQGNSLDLPMSPEARELNAT